MDDRVTKRMYPVRLLGRSLSIQTVAPREEVETVASFVAMRMEEVRAASRSTDVTEVAMLTALNLASDLLRAQTSLDEERARVKEWATGMCGRMDARMPDVPISHEVRAERITDPLE